MEQLNLQFQFDNIRCSIQLIQFVSMQNSFNQQQLQDCIDDRSNFIQKYAPFKKKFKEVNQEWIHKSVLLFKSILNDNQSPPMRKMHTIRAIKEGLETCQHGFLTLIEVEILPIFMDIARYRKEDKDEDRGRSLFLSGIKNQKQKQQAEMVGNSYLRIILECIQVWAKVKPYWIVDGYQIQEVDSQFMLALKQLKSEGVSFPSHLTYFKPGEIEQLQRNMEQRTTNILQNRERYTQYYKIILLEGLSDQRIFMSQNTQHLIRVYKYGDSFLISDALRAIQYNLIESSASPVSKILSLKMLNQLFKSDQFDVLEFTNKLTPLLTNIIINLDSNDHSLRRGELFFKGNFGKKYGPIYYADLLKSLQLWASCVPSDLYGKNHPSQFVLALQKLKDQKKLQFVKVGSTEFSNYKQEFLKYHQKNQMKNDVMRQIQNDASIQTPGSLKNTSIVSKQLHQQSSFMNRQNRKSSSQIILNLPNFQTQNLMQRNETLRQIYYQMQQLKPSNQIYNKQWLLGSINYISKYCDLSPSTLVGSSQINRVTVDNLEKAQKILGVFDKYQDNSIKYSELLNQIKGINRGSHLSLNNSEAQSNFLLSSKNKMPSSQQEIIPIMVSNLNTNQNNITHNDTINKTAYFVSGFPSNNRLPDGQSINYHQNGIIQAPMPQVPLPNYMQTISSSQSIQDNSNNPIKIPIESDLSLEMINKNIPSFQNSFNNKVVLPTPIVNESKQFSIRRSEQSRENISIGKKDQRSDSFSDAFRSKQKITIEGFDQNLLDSKLSLLNKEESERRIQESMSLKNMINRSGSLNSIQGNIPAQSLPPRSSSPIPNMQRPPLPPSLSPKSQLTAQQGSVFLQKKSLSPKPQFIKDNQSKTLTRKQQLVRKQEDSKIVQHLLEPLQNSYYDLNDMMIQKQSNSTMFQKVFESRKYCIGENLSSSKEYFQKQAVILKSTPQKMRTIGVQQTLNEIQSRHARQLQHLQEYYLRIIRTLEDKIQYLQSKLQHHNYTNYNLSKQLDSIKGSISRSQSSNGKTERSRSNINLDEKMRSIKYDTKQPIGRRFNDENIQYHLRQLRDVKLKKIMLKNKELLFRNEAIEIGCMVSKDTSLKIVLYATSSKNLLNFNLRIHNPGKLKIGLYPYEVVRILEPQKQEKFVITIQTPELNILPFQIPVLQFSFYQSSSEYISSHEVLLPCTINRFFDYHEVKDCITFSHLFENIELVIRTKETLLNSKIIKQHATLKQLMPKFSKINTNNDFNMRTDVVYGSEVSYLGYNFLIRCVIRPSESVYWQAIDPSRECPDVVMHCLLTTLSWLVSN